MYKRSFVSIQHQCWIWCSNSEEKMGVTRRRCQPSKKVHGGRVGLQSIHVKQLFIHIYKYRYIQIDRCVCICMYIYIYMMDTMKYHEGAWNTLKLIQRILKDTLGTSQISRSKAEVQSSAGCSCLVGRGTSPHRQLFGSLISTYINRA